MKKKMALRGYILVFSTLSPATELVSELGACASKPKYLDHLLLHRFI